ncbi:MAG: hypothetical protein JAZ11_02795 [Candidatus Thiodiazotropha lotti]|nr:hypothetical protein [Candidatus Thiodiazotropha lotti]
MKLLNSLRIAVLIAGLTITPLGKAGLGIVYDPWNHAENIAQLVQQVQQVQQAIQMVTDQQQLLRMAGLDQMKWIIDLVQVHQQQGTLAALRTALGQFYSQAQSAQGATEGIYRQYLQSDLDWNGYIDRENRIAQANHGVHTAAFQHATQTQQGLEQQHRTIQELSSRTDSAMGTQQLLQTLNKHMNLIATQNTQLLGLQTQSSQTDNDAKAQLAAKHQEEIEKQQAAKAVSDAMIENVRDALSPISAGDLR